MSSPATWALFLVCAFLAEVMGTMAGFGAATVLTPIATLFMDVKTAIAIVACFHLFGNTSRLYFFWRQIQWRVWAQFGIVGILASWLGSHLTAHLSSALVGLLLGVFLVLYVGYSLAWPGGMQLPRSAATLVGGGLFSGLIAGLIGTGGAIRSACLLAAGLLKEAYLGTSAAIALVVDATRVPVYLAEEFVPSRMAPLLISLVLVAFLGAWCGQRLVRRISPVAFRRFVLLMLLVMGIKLCVDGFR